MPTVGQEIGSSRTGAGMSGSFCYRSCTNCYVNWVLTRNGETQGAGASLVLCYKCEGKTRINALDSAEPVVRFTSALDNNSSHDVECKEILCDSYHKLDSTSTEPIASVTPAVLDNNNASHVEECEENHCDTSNIDTSTLCSPQVCEESAVPSGRCDIKDLNDDLTSTNIREHSHASMSTRATSQHSYPVQSDNIHEHSCAGIFAGTPSPHTYQVESENNDDQLLSAQTTALVNTVEPMDIDILCEPDKKTPMKFKSSLLDEFSEKTMEPSYSGVASQKKTDHSFPDLHSDPQRDDNFIFTKQIDGITNSVFRIVDNVLKCHSGQLDTTMLGSGTEQALGGLIIGNNSYSVVSYSEVCMSDSLVVNSDIGANHSKLVDIDLANCQSVGVKTERRRETGQCSVYDRPIDLSMSSTVARVLSKHEQTLLCTKSESESIINFYKETDYGTNIDHVALIMQNDKTDDLIKIDTTPCPVEKYFQKEHLKKEMLIFDSIASDAMQSQQVDQMDVDKENDDIVNNEPVDDHDRDVINAQPVDKDDPLQGAILDLILCPLDESQASRNTCCHQCRVCPKIFRYIAGVASHERSHTDRLPYAGRMRSRKNVAVYESHSEKDEIEKAETSNEDEDNYSEVEESEDEQTHLCHHCYKEFDTRLKLNRHVNRIHKGEEIIKHSKTETNTAVLFGSTINGTLVNEIQATRERTHACTHCDNRYFTMKNLNVHIRSKHKGERLTPPINPADKSKLSSISAYELDIVGKAIMKCLQRTADFKHQSDIQQRRCTMDGRNFTSFPYQQACRHLSDTHVQSGETAVPDRKIDVNVNQVIDLQSLAACSRIVEMLLIRTLDTPAQFRQTPLTPLVQEAKSLPNINTAAEFNVDVLPIHFNSTVSAVLNDTMTDHQTAGSRTVKSKLTQGLCQATEQQTIRPLEVKDKQIAGSLLAVGQGTGDGLTNNIRRQTGGRPFACVQCDKTYQKLADLRRHVLRFHNGVNLYTCDKCSMKFNRDQEEVYKLHRESHADQQPFACTECDKRYGSRKTLRLHVRFVHKKERNCVCAHCGKAYRRKHELDEHIRQIHTGERLYICTQCGNRFASHERLFQHENSHTKNTFMCTLCDKRFVSRIGQNSHIRRVHNDERLFSCSQCQKKFKTKTGMNTHMVSHTREQAYKCKHCDKKFGTFSSRYRHTNEVHVGEDRYKCPHCDMKLTQKTSLIRHLGLLHSGECSYVCGECEKRFYDATLLRQHLQTHK